MQYRAIKVNVDMPTIQAAREWIKYSFNNDSITLHDNKNEYFDLFKELPNEKTIHPHFNLLKESDFFPVQKKLFKKFHIIIKILMETLSTSSNP